MNATTARKAVEVFLGRLKHLDDDAIFISTAEPEALRTIARRVDRQPADEVPLRGLLFAVKDNIDVVGLATTAGCPQFSYDPQASATVVERLMDAGAIPVGKTNLDQFATGLVGTRSPFGTPRNPHDAQHVPGGSSSGSAVAVARGLVDFALGTDTAGSGRVPAAFCGVVGTKPTPGSIPTTGVVPAVRSIDCVSIFSRTVQVGQQVVALTSGPDGRDAYARHAAPATAPTAAVDTIIGIASDAMLAQSGTEPDFIDAYRSTVAHLTQLGFRTRETDFSSFLAAGDLLYGGPWVAERTAAVGDFIAAEPQAVDPVVAEIINGGHTYSAVEMHRASYAMADHINGISRTFAAVDMVVLPTVPCRATLAAVAADPVGLNTKLGRFTTFANLADLCAVSVPHGPPLSGGLPFGVTVYGPAWEDAAVAHVADALQQGADTMEPRPPDDGLIRLVVAGAHLRGQPLAHQLTDLGARYEQTIHTTPNYRLYELAGGSLAKPGLVYDPDGVAIEVDVWQLSAAALGSFLQLVPAPLALGRVELADGTAPTGFVCEPRALDGATELTQFGGWRASRASRQPSQQAAR